MLDFNTVTEFSHTHCIAICAFLVPANLLTTLQTGILTGLNRPRIQVWASVAVASLWATAMIFHVFTWFAIGVVMPPTYILLAMGITCLAINVWALGHPASMMQLIRVAVSAFREVLEAGRRKKSEGILKFGNEQCTGCNEENFSDLGKKEAERNWHRAV